VYAIAVALHSWCLPPPQSRPPDLADIKRAEQGIRSRPREFNDAGPDRTPYCREVKYHWVLSNTPSEPAL